MDFYKEMGYFIYIVMANSIIYYSNAFFGTYPILNILAIYDSLHIYSTERLMPLIDRALC